MKKLLAILLLLSSSPIFSQNHYIGAHGGVSWTNVETDGSFDRLNYRVGILTGFNYQYQFKNKIQIGMSLDYAQKGFNADFKITNINGDELGGGRVEWNYDYLSLPLKVGYSIGKDFSGFINLGLVPSFLIIAEINSHLVKTSSGGITNVIDETNPVDIAGMLELGMSYNLSEQLVMIALCNAQGSLTSFEKNDIFNNNPNHIGLAAMIGVRYRFIKQ